jgi:Raf kinase inhibitor-like YbhB/YbcL family protein
MALQVTSSAFTQGGMIPKQYTCDGKNISPPLAWTGVPSNAKSQVLIADDPDAPVGTWVHWVVFNIPSAVRELPEAIAPIETLPTGGTQGKSSFGKIGYGGPCPPSGAHRYFFKIYALDTELNLRSASTKDDVVKAMDGHVIAEGQLMGKYQRS